MPELLTMQDLANGHLDVKALGEAANGDENTIVTTRTGNTYPSAERAINIMFQNGGLPATPFKTKALMTASALANDKYAMVTDDTDNNGLYVKTAGAWVKSDYDPLKQAKSTISSITSTLDLSELSGSYALTFSAALQLIPDFMKKTGLTITYNNQYPLTYVSNNLDSSNWTNPRLWIAQIYNDDTGIPAFDKRMIRKGFILTSGTGVELGEDNYCAIIPVRPLGEGLSPVTLSPKMGGNIRFNFHALNKGGVTIAQAGGAFEYSVAKSATLGYIAVNLQWRDTVTGLMVNEGAVDIAKNFMSYKEGSASTVVTAAEAVKNTFSEVVFSPNTGVTMEMTPAGMQAVNPYFVTGGKTDGKLHIAQFVKKVEVSKGHRGLINKKTGELRRLFISGLSHNPATRVISISVGMETAEGGPATAYIVSGKSDADGVAVITWARSIDYDPVRVKMTIDTRNLAISYAFSAVEVHPSIVAKGLETSGYANAMQLTSFVNMGVAKTVSNYKYNDPVPANNISAELVNGMPFTTVKGETGKDHQQTTLMSSKLSRMSGGRSNIYVEANAIKTGHYPITVLREESSIDPLNIGGSHHDLRGPNDSQYVHPDMTYSPTAVGGYKYWMVNSNYPDAADEKEESDLFVSNDGQDWKRVKGANEFEEVPLGVKNPEVFWDTPWKNAFSPSPYPGNEFEFALDGSLIVTDKVQSRLTHDPAITSHNGYIIVYTLYNFKLITTTPGIREYKFVTCLRTNNGVTWEIVREDGTTMPYNEANAKKIFSKTGTVRNHHLFRSRPVPGGTRGVDLSPQVVKVSDNEWYMYTRNGAVSPTQGYDLYLNRYSGTTPYTFDYDNPVAVYKDENVGGSLWHFGLRYIDGLYYLITNGFLMTSTDGISFTTYPYPFFWRGMSSDLYKPSFVKGHDGLIKVVYGIKHLSAAPNGLAPQLPVGTMNSANRIFYKTGIMATIGTQFSSLADMVSKSSNPTSDGYVDVVVTVISLRSRTIQTRFFPGLRESFYLKEAVDIGPDDEVYVLAHMNTRHGGSVNFGGVSLDQPNNAYLALQ